MVKGRGVLSTASLAKGRGVLPTASLAKPRGRAQSLGVVIAASRTLADHGPTKELRKAAASFHEVVSVLPGEATLLVPSGRIVLSPLTKLSGRTVERVFEPDRMAVAFRAASGMVNAVAERGGTRKKPAYNKPGRLDIGEADFSGGPRKKAGKRGAPRKKPSAGRKKPTDKVPAFRCVEQYEACLVERTPLAKATKKFLCSTAFVVCLAGEIKPFAGIFTGGGKSEKE